MNHYRNPGEDDSLDAALQEEIDLEMTEYDFVDSSSDESATDDEENMDNEENEEVDPADETDLPEDYDDDADDREFPDD